MTWTKQPAWTEPVHIGCLNCSSMHGNQQLCQLNRYLAVGFGDVQVMKDGYSLYSEMHAHGEFPTLQKFEDMALVDPDHDWRVHFMAPLYEAEYQRHGPGEWVLIRSGMGFA